MSHRFTTSKPITPLTEPGSARLLWWIAIVILIAGCLMLGINLVNQVGIRPGAPILIGVASGMLILLHWNKMTWYAAWLLCLGGMFSSLMASYGTLGLLSMNWLTMPLVIMIGGWLLGRTAVIILSLLALAAVLGMYLLHTHGHVFPQDYALGTVATGLATTMIVSGLVAGSLATVFQRQLIRLNESRTHLTTLFDTLDDLVWSVDVQNFHLLSYNQAFADYMLTHRGIVVRQGMTPEQLTPAETARAHWLNIYRQVLERDSLQQEYQSTFRDRIHLISLKLMQREGKAFAISAIAHNITEEKNIQQRLENAVEQRTRELSVAKESAEVANRSKGYFLANMSHEIRTPLTAILGFAETLKDRALDENERLQAVHTIIRNSQHLQGLISDILDFSKIEAGQLDIERAEIPFPAFLADLNTLSQALAGNRELDFSCHIVPPIPSHIETDITRLRQILINLISNAVKFTGNPGRVRLLVSCDQSSGQLVFSVQDSGIGIRQDALCRLFQPFAQADITTTRRFGGTGLGLSISQELAIRLGGHIQVLSVEHLGSLFIVTVTTGPPQHREWLETPEQWGIVATEEAHSWNTDQTNLTGRVLLAEDTPDNQRLINLLMQRTGAELIIANNGAEAVEQAQEMEFDLILMDMQMPVMGGIEATRLLRLTGFDGPIVALTANATETEKAQALEAGCNDFMTKPLNQQTFFKLLNRYLPEAVDRPNPPTRIPPMADLENDPEYQALRRHFVQELPERLASIQAALADADWDALKSRAHQLKGVAGSFGYPDTSRIAGQIESCLVAGNHRPLQQLVRQLTSQP